jgi:hypothetical protein
MIRESLFAAEKKRAKAKGQKCHANTMSVCCLLLIDKAGARNKTYISRDAPFFFWLVKKYQHANTQGEKKGCA